MAFVRNVILRQLCYSITAVRIIMVSNTYNDVDDGT